MVTPFAPVQMKGTVDRVRAAAQREVARAAFGHEVGEMVGRGAACC